jgi:hypothetical protein
MPKIPDYPPESGASLPEEADQTEDASSTLIVPPPDFKERLAAAQRARELQARRAMEFKTPPPTLAQQDVVPEDIDRS